MSLFEAIGIVGADTRRLRGDMRRSEGIVSASVGRMSSVAGGILAAAGITSLIGTVKNLGMSFISANAQMEAFGTSMEVMLGSATRADAMLQEIQAFAASTPFEVPGLVQTSQQMLTFGFEAERVLPMLKNIGDAASASPEGMQFALHRIVRALGQIRAKGKVSAEEMMQLTEAGIPAWELLAKKMGKTIPEIQAMTKKGIIPANDAIDMMVEGMGERFPDMMKRQSKSFSGLMSTLSDNMGFIIRRVGKPFFDLAKLNLQNLMDWWDSGAGEQMVQWAIGVSKSIAAWIQNAIDFVKENRSVIAGVIKTVGVLIGMKAAAMAFAVALGSVKGAMIALMLSNPFTLILQLIPVAIAAIVGFGSDTESVFHGAFKYVKSFYEGFLNEIELFKTDWKGWLDSLWLNFKGTFITIVSFAGQALSKMGKLIKDMAVKGAKALGALTAAKVTTEQTAAIGEQIDVLKKKAIKEAERKGLRGAGENTMRQIESAQARGAPQKEINDLFKKREAEVAEAMRGALSKEDQAKLDKLEKEFAAANKTSAQVVADMESNFEDFNSTLKDNLKSFTDFKVPDKAKGLFDKAAGIREGISEERDQNKAREAAMDTAKSFIDKIAGFIPKNLPTTPDEALSRAGGAIGGLIAGASDFLGGIGGGGGESEKKMLGKVSFSGLTEFNRSIQVALSPKDDKQKMMVDKLDEANKGQQEQIKQGSTLIETVKTGFNNALSIF